jgi:hypothetical protein
MKWKIGKFNKSPLTFGFSQLPFIAYSSSGHLRIPKISSFLGFDCLFFVLLKVISMTLGSRLESTRKPTNQT